MPVKVFSCMVQGITGRLVEVEADILRGLSSFKIVGLGDTAVQESKERIRSAIKNSGAVYPQQKKIINLAPANMHKAGPQFDLPIALSILAASSQIRIPEDAIFLGELALNGEVKPVRGIISACIFAKKSGHSKLFIPEENMREASLVKGINIYPLKSLHEIIAHLQRKKEIQTYSSEDKILSEYNCADTLSEIIGQEKAKRALQIAAAGHHHITM
jgi:magnesium chelatase family protein